MRGNPIEHILKLIPLAMIPILASIIFSFLEKKGTFRKWKPALKQLMLGIVFGIISVCGSEFGVDIDGAIINVRDAGPICAGLIFGAPAGIIAGVIGGVERFFAVLWGGGTYTRIACSVSTVTAGCLAGLVRKKMFDDKSTEWFYGLAVGTILEIFHLFMIFLTHISTTHEAFRFVKACAVPMVSVNSIAVCLAVLFTGFIEKSGEERTVEKHTILKIFQKWLLFVVLFALGFTLLFVQAVQTKLEDSDTQRVMKLNMEDLQEEITSRSDENILDLAYIAATYLNYYGGIETDDETLNELADSLEVKEINVTDSDGIIILSTNPDFLGFDFKSGEQSSEFMIILDGITDEVVQGYQPITYDPSISRKYAAVAYHQGMLQIGYDAEDFQEKLMETISGLTRYRRIGAGGYMLIADRDGNIISSPYGDTEGKITEIGAGNFTEVNEPMTLFRATIGETEYFCSYSFVEGFVILSLIPADEAMFSRNLFMYVTTFMEILVFAGMFAVVFYAVKRNISDNMAGINRSLHRITDGDLNVKMDVRDNREFSDLSDEINLTVDTIKKYIAKEKERIEKELELAKNIQASALPNTFPAFPDRKEIDIWADMTPAKDVGGDFYDFYFVGPNQLAFLVADVSGKGIPAAMFMMRAKTMIKSRMEAGVPVNEALEYVNNKLCEGNEAGMFVTCWLGCLNLSEGKILYSNAGHNMPVIRRAGGQFEFLKMNPGFVLAGMEGIHYRMQECEFHPGDSIFLYTDGVTEATNLSEELYGNDRLIAALNGTDNCAAKEICIDVRKDMDRFVGTASQFDDITVLCLEYLNPEKN